MQDRLQEHYQQVKQMTKWRATTANNLSTQTTIPRQTKRNKLLNNGAFLIIVIAKHKIELNDSIDNNEVSVSHLPTGTNGNKA